MDGHHYQRYGELLRAYGVLSARMADAEHNLRTIQAEHADMHQRLLDCVGAPAAPRRGPPPAVRAVVDLLREAGEPMSREDIADALHLTQQTTAMRISRAVRLGLVKRTEHGSFVAVETPTTV